MLNVKEIKKTMLNGKDSIIHLIVGFVKIPEPVFLGTNVKVELDLSNYVTKTDLKIRQILLKRLIWVI